ncbi:MAG: glucan biosynthesis protein G [bacterium]
MSPCAWSLRNAAALVLLALFSALPVVLARSAFAFGIEDVNAEAQALAEKPFEKPKTVPDWLGKIDYDQWRDARFRPERALWRDRAMPFEVQFFHPGFLYQYPVEIFMVEADGIRPVLFSPSLFDYGKNTFASKVPQDLGFAGFRIHYPIKSQTYKDEVAVFLGASYFRAVGQNQVFGLSARGLAIDTASSHGEEFPFFRRFWLVAPAPKAQDMVIYALLDSQSLTGAYAFLVDPGEQTVIKVDCRLFFRNKVEKIGVGPLTSMFFHGENTRRCFDDFRPEAHDSDGALVQFATGEWLWRPVDNRDKLNVSSFDAPSPRGFGLLQRDRNFGHYQDLETRQDLRPSAWIIPAGEWGPGRFELVEIPAESDTNDNIVCYWVPAAQPDPGAQLAFTYRVVWGGDNPALQPGGRVVSTGHDKGTYENAHRFVVNFEGKKLNTIPADRVLHGALTVVGGPEVAEVLDQYLIKNTVTGGWRLSFQVRPSKREPIELRAFLDQGGEALTETWSYVILP